MRQLKQFMKAKKGTCSNSCECLTINMWRCADLQNGKEFCGCGEGGMQIEVNPYPGLDDAIQFTMPGTDRTWVAAIMPGIGGGEDVILVVEADKLDSEEPAGFVYVNDASSYDTFNDIGAFVTYDEDKYALLTDAIGVGQGEISSEASSLIINDYNKYAKTTIIAKLEQGDGFVYLGLYDYRTNKKLGDFDSDFTTLIDLDAHKAYAQLRKGEYVDWVDSIYLPEVGATSIVAYQLSEVFREGLSLKASDMVDFFTDGIAGDDNRYTGATNDAYYYDVDLNSNLVIVGDDAVLNNGIMEIRQDLEYYIFPIGDVDSNYIEVNKNPNKNTFSVDGEGLRKDSPLIRVLEGLSREVIDNSFYHCDGAYNFINNAMLIFQNVDDNPTEENIQSAITELNKFQSLSQCTK